MQENFQNEKSSENDHLIMVGSVLPDELKKELMLRCKEVSLRLPEGSNSIIFVELEKDEMSLVVSNRKKIQEHKDSIKTVSDLERRKEMLKLISKFKEGWPVEKNTFGARQLKDRTNLSWSQFNTIIDNIVLLGLAVKPEKDVVKFLVSDEEISQIAVARINEVLENSIKEIEIIEVNSKFDKQLLRKLNALKKKLSF